MHSLSSWFAAVRRWSMLMGIWSSSSSYSTLLRDVCKKQIASATRMRSLTATIISFHIMKSNGPWGEELARANLTKHSAKLMSRCVSMSAMSNLKWSSLTLCDNRCCPSPSGSSLSGKNVDQAREAMILTACIFLKWNDNKACRILRIACVWGPSTAVHCSVAATSCKYSSMPATLLLSPGASIALFFNSDAISRKRDARRGAAEGIR